MPLTSLVSTGWDLKIDKKGNKKEDWIIFSRDGGLKSGKNIRESRDNGIKVITRLNSNFVVRRFGNEFKGTILIYREFWITLI